MSKYEVNVNPFNHMTAIGKIDKRPKFIKADRWNHNVSNVDVFKVSIKAPRNYFNHSKSGRVYRRYDELRASCYITEKQARFYKDKFVPGKWVVIRGEIRSVDYYQNPNKIHIQAHPFNLEDIEPYKVPNTDKFAITSYDKSKLVHGIKGLNWILDHPGLVRRFARPAYAWLMAHDAFVPTRIEDDNQERKINY